MIEVCKTIINLLWSYDFNGDRSNYSQIGQWFWNIWNNHEVALQNDYGFNFTYAEVEFKRHIKKLKSEFKRPFTGNVPGKSNFGRSNTTSDLVKVLKLVVHPLDIEAIRSDAVRSK